MIRGTRVTIGGKEYLMPPANWKTLDKHDEFLQRYMGAVKSGGVEAKRDDMKTMFEIVHEALQRNYPQLAADELKEHVDFGNLPELFQAAMQTSGFEEGRPGEQMPANGRTGAS